MEAFRRVVHKRACRRASTPLFRGDGFGASSSAPLRLHREPGGGGRPQCKRQKHCVIEPIPAGSPASAVAAALPATGAGVFKLEVVRSRPDVSMPLLPAAVGRSTRACFALQHGGANHLLTTASAVEYATQILVYKPDAPEPFKAVVDFLDCDADLALLRLSDGDAFWAAAASTPPLPPPEQQQQQQQQQLTTLGPVPGVGQAVHVAGPASDANSTFVAGVVTVVDALPYAGGILRLPGIELEASIGRSMIGSPVLDAQGRCVGVVRKQRGADRRQARPATAQAAPSLLLDRFLEDAARRRQQRGWPALGVRWRKLESPALARYVMHGSDGVPGPHTSAGAAASASGAVLTQESNDFEASDVASSSATTESSSPSALVQSTGGDCAACPEPGTAAGAAAAAAATSRGGGDRGGVLIIEVAPVSCCASILQPGDVVVAVDGLPVSSSGTIQLPAPALAGAVSETAAGAATDPMGWMQWVSLQPVGSQTQLRVRRRGALLTVSVTLQPLDRLVPLHLSGKQPSYLVLSGLVFTTCTVPYMAKAYGGKSQWLVRSPVKLLDRALGGFCAVPGERIPVICHFESGMPALRGYDSEAVAHKYVTRLNGKPVRSLAQLAAGVLGCCEELLSLQLDDDSLVVLDRKQAAKDTAELLSEYNVKSGPVSKDLAHLLAPAASRASAAAAGGTGKTKGGRRATGGLAAGKLRRP